MKQLPRIAARLYCEPWAILPQQHSEICQQFRAALERADIEAGLPAAQLNTLAIRNAADDPVGPCYRDENGRAVPWHPAVEVRGNLAIMRVSGIIGKHLSALEMWCGGCDSFLVAQQAKNITADPRIKRVVIVFDSPGGNCVGCKETAEAIHAMSKAGKETIAYTDTKCASAAYYWAAACDIIVAAPSSILGSISTFCAMLDESRRYEMEGLQVHVFRTGEVKGAGTRGKPWTDEEKQFYQTLSEQFGAQFKGFVAEQRKIGNDLMQGQFWPAEFAPEGIVDYLENDLQSLLSAFEK